MKLLFTATVAAALAHSTSAASCAIATLAKILTDQYIDQCASDSGYVFTSGVQPTPTEVAGMCASSACHSLLADVVAMNLTECTLPIGNGIYLFADLITYVSDQCEADTDTPAPTTAAPEPTAAPTPEPTTATPAPTAATPAPTTAIASCTSAQLRYLLTSSYEAQCVADTKYPFTAPTLPTDEQVAALCASESCVNLLAYVSSMVTTDCRIPVGGKILLLEDLVDYVSDQCEAETPAPTTAAPTPEPTTATPAPTTATPVATCAVSVLSSLLTDKYIDQCASDSKYSFTSGVQPTTTEVAGMCASSSCANLLADVEALGLSECILPIGNKIYLFRDLVDYVADQCSASTPTPTTQSPSPSTPTPTTETSITPTPTTTTPVTTCVTSVLSALLTDKYIDQCASDSKYSFTSGVQPDPEEVAAMCASSACANLLVDVEALGLSECILPIGNKIYLFRDLVDYVADQCNGSSDTPSPTTTAPEPTTEAPGTEPPGTTAPSSGSSSTGTPETEAPITSTPGTSAPGTPTPGSEAPSTPTPGTDTPTTAPTTETPEPTSPTHDSC